MAQVIFQYNGITTTIECQENQKIFEIFKNFLNESNLNENEANYFYDGKQISEFDKNSTFYEMANSFDKIRKKMSKKEHAISEEFFPFNHFAPPVSKAAILQAQKKMVGERAAYIWNSFWK